MPTAAQLLPTIAPEFSGTDTSAAIDVAEMQIGINVGGDKRPLLVAYLAAHVLTLGQRRGAAGGVSSMSEGSLSISYGGGGEGLGATSYGAEFERISRGCVFAARTRVENA